jgi:hypothetical protein
VASRFGSRAWTAMAKLARGRVLAARGRVDAAFEAFEEARIAFEEIGSPYEAARCLMAQSRLFKTGKRATSLMEAARRALTDLGAVDLES